MTPAPGPARRRRRLLFAVLLGLASLLVSLTAVEILLRVAWSPSSLMAEFQQKGLYVELPDGSASLQPGYRGTLQLTPAEPRTTVAINTLGMRGPEVAPKRDGEHRLLVVGDSLVFGYGVDDAETFCRQLETRVRTSGRDLTVGNGGVSGFNSFEAARRIGHLRPSFAPDAVLWCCYFGNDAIENRNDDVAVVGGLRFHGPFARLMQRSARARWMARSRTCLWIESWLFVNKPDWSLVGPLADAVPDDRMAGFPGAPGGPTLDAGLFLDVIDEGTSWPRGGPPVLPRALADFRRGIEQAKTEARGLPLHVLILPMWCHCTAADWEAAVRRAGLDPASLRRGAIQERLAQLCAELGVPALDATPWLAAAGDTASLFVSDKGHLSPRGNSVIAEHLARELAPLWTEKR